MRRTRTFYGPGCPHCGHLYATRAQARRHQCDPQERERWQAHLQPPTGTPPGTVDLGNGFVLRLPTDDDEPPHPAGACRLPRVLPSCFRTRPSAEPLTLKFPWFFRGFLPCETPSIQLFPC
jgi:hypothetical protein